MKHRKPWILTVLVLVAYLALPMPGNSASLNDKIERKREQVDRKKRREGVLTTDISGYSNRIRSLQGDIRGYADREQRLQVSLDGKRAEVERVQDRLEIQRDKLVKLRARLKESTDALANRLVQIYKDDDPDILTVILEADGMADLLDRTVFLERISEQDQKIVGRVRVLKKQAQKLTKELAELEKLKQDAADAILAQKTQVAEARSQLVSRQNALADARAERRTVLATIQEDRHGLEGDLRELKQEQARVQARIRAAQSASSGGGGGGGGSSPGPIRQGGGTLIWPANGPVSSGFGQRWGRLHAGIDIPLPVGTPIRAAASGKVIISGPTGGYGNYICISHGTLSTCYGHNSQLNVSVGQSVKQGQVIALSGNTGNSTGPHLHFETRINGSPVDPMGYL
jgi:murein DD-endopeptidase MepM/ murein hydrolase activator NlpD